MLKRTSYILLFLLQSSLFIAQENLVVKDSIVPVALEEKDSIVLNWIPTFDEAREVSKNIEKPILIYFTGSDWCAPCKILDRDLFYTSDFKDFAERNLVLLEVDIPRNQDLLSDEKMSENLYLQRKYKVKSFPTLLFTNHRGKKISEKKGYILTEYYLPYIQSIVSNYK